MSQPGPKPSDARWRLEGDALDAVGLRVAVQRIGAGAWQAQGALRSWGVAGLHRDGDTLFVPCADDEALWIGAWPEPAGLTGTVSLCAPGDVRRARIELPREQAIAALPGGCPITRPAAQPQHELLLTLESPAVAPVHIGLTILSPGVWTARAGRAWTPLVGPPPLPPRLGRRR